MEFRIIYYICPEKRIEWNGLIHKLVIKTNFLQFIFTISGARAVYKNHLETNPQSLSYRFITKQHKMKCKQR